MIFKITDTEEDVINRAKTKGHDGSLDKYIQWYDRTGGRRTRRPAMTDLQSKAYTVVSEMKSSHSYIELENKIGIYPTMLKRILNKLFDQVPDKWLHKAASYRYDLPEWEDDTPTEEEEKQARKLLKEGGAEDNVKDFCRLHDLAYQQVRKVLKRAYKSPQPIVHEIIEKLS